MAALIINHPPTHTTKDVENAFQLFRTEEPELTEQWIGMEEAQPGPDFDITEIQQKVIEFLMRNYSWTNGTALFSFWMDLRSIAFKLGSNRGLHQGVS